MLYLWVYDQIRDWREIRPQMEKLRESSEHSPRRTFEYCFHVICRKLDWAHEEQNWNEYKSSKLWINGMSALADAKPKKPKATKAQKAKKAAEEQAKELKAAVAEAYKQGKEKGKGKKKGGGKGNNAPKSDGGGSPPARRPEIPGENKALKQARLAKDADRTYEQKQMLACIYTRRPGGCTQKGCQYRHEADF